MRKAIDLTGPGASMEEVAAALGVTPERQAANRDVLSSQLQGKSPRNGSAHKLPTSKVNKKKAASRK